MKQTRFLREPEVLERTGLSRPTRWRLERLGRFPKRRKIGLAAVGWVDAEVEDWIQSRARGAGAPTEPFENAED